MSIQELIGAIFGPSRPKPVVLKAIAVPEKTAIATNDALNVTAAAGALKRLSELTAPGGTPADWLLVAGQLAKSEGPNQVALTSKLVSAGYDAFAVGGPQPMSIFIGAESIVVVDPDNKRVRMTEGNQSRLFEDGKVVVSISEQDGKFTVVRGKTTQVWDAATNVGLENGKPIVPRPAPVVPDEKPRKPWATMPASRLELPEYDGDDDAFVKAFDAAVVKTGSQIIVPMRTDIREPDWSNCHAFALTDGRGDLADPFSSVNKPRWLNSPHYQLATGPYGKLASEQRVHPGDIILYKNMGVTTHTGLVREVDADGNPSRVESKYGNWGTYVHGPFDALAPYGPPAEFYRPLRP